MNKKYKNRTGNRKFPSASPFDVSLRSVCVLVCAVLICFMLLPTLLNAQGDESTGSSDDGTGEIMDTSGYDPEDAVQPSGMDGEPDLILDMLDDSYQFSPGRGESFESMMEGITEGIPFEPEEGYELSVGEGESLVPAPGLIELPDLGEEPFDLSAGDDEFVLPGISTPDFGNIYGLNQASQERTIFNTRPRDQFYSDVVRRASDPDITGLGPLPAMVEEGVEFTDVAADWIYHQKSVGMTELRGHVMIVYDTTIISCDEAILDEMNEIYRFFGEGRVFVDDADFNLECDELEIHDSEDEKIIYITGRSEMVVYADEDAEEPGEGASRRDRLNYALKQQDTIITFTDAEYDYENDIFDAHGGVRFEQTDKYAEGDEFHGENETEYTLFTGDVEFWQQDGQWLYEYRVVEDEESPPSRGDKITRALLSVPTTVTADEFEARGSIGWMQLRSVGGDVVYFHQDDKHAECDLFTLWYTEEGTEPVEDETIEIPETPPIHRVPPGYGSLRLASEFSPDYIPWEAPAQVTSYEAPSFIDTAIEVPEAESINIEDILDSATIAQLEELGISTDLLEDIHPSYLSEFSSPEDIQGFLDSGALEEMGIPSEVVQQIDVSAFVPGFDEPEPEEEPGPVNGLSDLGDDEEALLTGEIPEDEVGQRDEIIMDGNVFIRQENGDWLFEYDIVDEEEETEENIEQYRKWANGSCDYLHVWTQADIVEATGAVSGEQDNQDMACDFLRYLGELDMLYFSGNVLVHREGKHQLMSNEGFLFFSTNIFEALGQVRTTVTVDVEERRGEAQGAATEGEEGEAEEEEASGEEAVTEETGTEEVSEG